MKKKMNDFLIEHVKSHLPLYLVSVGVFICGVMLGALWVNLLSGDALVSLEEWLGKSMAQFKAVPLVPFELFRISLISQMKMAGLMFLLSLVVVGIPFIYLLLGFRGFMVGFSAGLLARVLGGQGFFLFFTAEFLQLLLTVPVLLALSVNCVLFAYQKTTSRQNRFGGDSFRVRLARHGIKCTLLFFFLMLGSVVEGFIAPWLLKLFLQG